MVSAARPSFWDDLPSCDLCGTRMIYVHCKYICRRCGYTRDCSDP